MRPRSEAGLLQPGVGDVAGVRLPLNPEPAARAAGSSLDLTAAAWTEFHGRLRGFVARRVGSLQDAEDIVQELFLRMHRNASTLRRAESVGAWLHRTARNAIVDHYRRPSRRRERAVGDARELDQRTTSAPAEDDAVGASCAAECLRPLVERLPEAYRRAVDRVDLGGQSQVSAAAEEGLSVSGMKARVQRGRRLLKQLLLDRCRVEVDVRGGLLQCEPSGGAGAPCSRNDAMRR